MKVPWNFEGSRFDVVAQTLCQEWLKSPLPRSMAQKSIEKGFILLNGEPAPTNLRVSKGDMVLYTESFFKTLVTSENRKEPKGEEPELIFENDLFIVLYKPASWLSHEVSSYQKEATLEDWIAKKGLIPAEQVAEGRVHRLDRNTSGLILYAKNADVQRELKTLFQDRKMTKTYIALVEGHLEEKEGIITTAIERIKGSFKRIATEIRPEIDTQKLAETKYQAIASIDDYDLVLVFPKTGRTHQIRVHMAALGHPITGDTLYGSKDPLLSRQFLHAFRLAFDFHNEEYSFVCPLREDLQYALSTLDESEFSGYDNEALKTIGLKQG